MAVIKWGDVTSQASPITAGMDALADGANAFSALLSNDQSTELDVYSDWILFLNTQGAARDANAFVSMYILPEVEGNVPYGSAALDPAGNLLVGAFQYDAVVTARYAVLRAIILPPDDFHVLVINETGQALAANGSILDYRTYNLETV